MRRLLTIAACVPGVLLLGAALAQPPSDDGVEPERLLDRTPFDRITLNAANGGAVIETVLLELPERKVPNPLPEGGSLTLRRISEPSVAYSVRWSDVAKVELYEQLLLDEALRLTATDKFAEAFEYLAFLRAHYPDLPGLENAMQDFLWRDASTAFAAGRGDDAWPALVALYARNPNYPRLVNAIVAVSDRLIAERLDQKNYAGARAVLEEAARQFASLELPNVARWRTRFEADAKQQVAAAREALAAGDYDAARDAAMFAHAILPDYPPARAAIQEIQAAAPEIRVGVAEAARRGDARRAPTWAEARGARLLDPQLVEMVEFGAEGGVYASRFGKLSVSESGLETSLALTPAALRWGVTPDAVARQLLAVSQEVGAGSLRPAAGILQGVVLDDGVTVRAVWRRPHLHPEALLQFPLRGLTNAVRGPGLWFEPLARGGDAAEARYQRTGPIDAAPGAPRLVVERVFPDDDAAAAALLAGEIDVLDRVPPWQVDRLQQSADIAVVGYRLPTVHVLIPNPQTPLLTMREFRRALCYGIDRESILRDIVLGGTPRPGFRPLSGPFPAGVGQNDPTGYAYNAEVPLRPYDPALSALLANVARTTLAKRDAEQRKAEARASGGDAKSPTTSSADAAGERDDNGEEDAVPPPTPLVLAHSADPVARLCCQAIKLQLDRVGMPVSLVEIPGESSEASVPCDLLYAELVVGEPLFDARRILGPSGVAGRAAALMTAALDRLDRAQNWNEARQTLREIHRIAHYDLPVIPLWQTVNVFARRGWLVGVDQQPITLYQNLDAWRKEF